MTAFNTLDMIIGQGKKPSSSSTLDVPSFLDYKIGYRVKSKNGGGNPFTIMAMDTDRMTYGSFVTVKDEADEERKLKGATLQSGYTFYDHGDIRDPQGGAIKTITINVDDIREFYPRKGNAPGTRIILKDKTTYIVANSDVDVRARIISVDAALFATYEDIQNLNHEVAKQGLALKKTLVKE
jgi:hypothetical protein